MSHFGVKLSMSWYSAVFASAAAAFSLMYRTASGAFESVSKNIIHSAHILGLSGTFTFWRIVMPLSRKGITAGAVLSFARALGEYEATSMGAQHRGPPEPHCRLHSRQNRNDLYSCISALAHRK